MTKLLPLSLACFLCALSSDLHARTWTEAGTGRKIADILARLIISPELKRKLITY